MLVWWCSLGILLLPACLPYTGNVKSSGADYWFDVSKLGRVSIRYTSDDNEQILPHNIARLSFTNSDIVVPQLTDASQLWQAGNDAPQALAGIKPPAFAAENFYVINDAAFYLQANDGSKHFCRLANIPLGSKRKFSLTAACQEDAREAEMVYFRHHFSDTEHKLNENILQIDCSISYGNKTQAIHLAARNGTIIDDQGIHAFAKQQGANFNITCRNDFWDKPIKEKTSKAVIAEMTQSACFEFWDTFMRFFRKGHIGGKTAAACNPAEELLSFYFSAEDSTRDDSGIPTYLRKGNPASPMDHPVTDGTSQNNILVLTQCDDCLPAWATQLRCTTTCKTAALAHTEKVAAPGTIIDAGAKKHYSQRLWCKNETQTLKQLSTAAALTCQVAKRDGEPATDSLALDAAIVKTGKVCVDFTPAKAITISAVANCHSKLRFFFRAAKPPA